MKLNFNKNSAKAWSVLIMAILSAITGVLSALGVNVNADLLTNVSSIVGAVISILVAGGILTQDLDKKDGDKK
jgi:Bacteriophage holin.